MTSSFDELFENLLTELTPVDIAGGYGGSGEETEATFPEKSAGKYELTPEHTKEVAKAVISKLREMGGHSDKSYKEFQEEDIAPIIKDVAGINMSNAKYAARVIHAALKNAGIITDERDGTSTLTRNTPTEEQIDDVADKADEIVQSSENEGEDDQETADSEFEDQDTLEEPVEDENEEEPSKEVSFSTHTDYYINPEDDIKAGTLTGDLRSVYDKLTGIAGETQSGEKILNTLSRSSLPQNKIKGYLKQLITKNVLEPQSGGAGGGEALEGSEENMRDVERREMESPSFQAAYRDYMKSGGGELSGRESSHE
jgi:DNA-binding transcriptional ArsR family regulator